MSLKLPDDAPNTGQVFSTTHLATGVATGAEAENVCIIGPTGGQVFPSAMSAGGNFKVAIVEDTVGSAVDTDDGAVAAAQGNIALVVGLPYVWNGSGWVRGGATTHSKSSAATTNATSVKGSPGVLYNLVVMNENAAARFIKFYDKASAPTVGTDTPALRFAIPGATTGGGFSVNFGPQGLAFAAGIAYALVTGAADANAGAVAADEIQVNLGYL